MSMLTIILAFIAFLFLIKLFSILGTKTGSEKPIPNPLGDIPNKESKTINMSEKAKTENNIETFLKGAKYMFENVNIAFANGNIEEFKDYMSKEIYDAFANAIKERENKGQKFFLQFVNIEKADIIDSSQNNGMEEKKVRFLSNQIRSLKDKNDEIIIGSDVRIDLVNDVWTFRKKVNSSDRDWKLCETLNNNEE